MCMCAEKESLAVAARSLRSLPARGIRPLYTARLVMLVIANIVNWLFALYGSVLHSNPLHLTMYCI